MSNAQSSPAISANVTGELVTLLKRDNLDASQLMGLVQFIKDAEGLSEPARTGYLFYLAGRLEACAEKGAGLRLIMSLEDDGSKYVSEASA